MAGLELPPPPMQTRYGPAIIRDLGLADYDSTFAAMRAFTDHG